jgi:hypothetical protein
MQNGTVRAFALMANDQRKKHIAHLASPCSPGIVLFVAREMLVCEVRLKLPAPRGIAEFFRGTPYETGRKGKRCLRL